MTNSLMNENWMNRKESAEDILIRGGDVLTVSGLERGDVLMRDRKSTRLNSSHW